MAELWSELDWTPYDGCRGVRLRVRGLAVREAAEYELCSEGGQMLIRRLVQHDGRMTASEACRGLPRDVLAAWAELTRAAPQ